MRLGCVEGGCRSGVGGGKKWGREGFGSGVCFLGVFGDGIRNRKGGGWVYGLGVFGQSIGEGRGR